MRPRGEGAAGAFVLLTTSTVPITSTRKPPAAAIDRKSTRLNSSHVSISYAVFCLKKNKTEEIYNLAVQSHVTVSFEIPDYTIPVVALGSLRFLDAIRATQLRHVTCYSASTSAPFV